MPDLAFLITQNPNILLPATITGWFGWFVVLIITILLNLKWKQYNQLLGDWQKRVFILLLISVPLVVLLLPSINLGGSGFEYFLPIFGAVPMYLAAGLFGPGMGAAMGFLSGLTISIFGGSDIFFPLGMALAGTMLGWFNFQEYRTPFFRLIRHSILGAILISLFYPSFILLDALLVGEGVVSGRIFSGLENVAVDWITFGLMNVVAGGISELIALQWKTSWGAQYSNLPSPAERNLSSRLLLTVVLLSFGLLAILIVSTWYVSVNISRQMIEGRLSTAGEMSAQAIPFYIETGKDLLIGVGSEPLDELSSTEIQPYLAAHRREAPYFSQLIYLRPSGEVVSSDPEDALKSTPITPGEIERIAMIDILPIDVRSIPTDQGSTTALLSFITGVKDPKGELVGILIGRSDLKENPFATPFITSLDSLSDINGQGMLVDDRGLILFHRDPNPLMSVYEGSRSPDPQLIEEYSPEGQKDLVYIQPVAGNQWSVILSVPFSVVQELAINLALPFIGFSLLFLVFIIVVIRNNLNLITLSLEQVSSQANHISSGDLNQSVMPDGVDEIGQLKIEFEKMRISLQTRFDQLENLYYVSQSIATLPDLESALKRVLDAAMVFGASSARVYLHQSIIPGQEDETSLPFLLGISTGKNDYAFLDQQVALLTQKQEIVKLNNLTRPKLFNFSNHQNPPQALLSIALRDETQQLGNLWIAFEDPHQFSEEEVSYISTLAGQAVQAIANASVYQSTRFDRQRLNLVLNSTSDLVIITDRFNNLVLQNFAANNLFDFNSESWIGMPISELIPNKELLSLFESEVSADISEEIVFSDGRTYLAMLSSVEVDEISIGKVCVLRDMTSSKQVTTSKTDFVSTVSHDLRSRLALIQGYTSMLQMLGDMNEQQVNFVNKISEQTEKISHLVANLLDLERIEAEIGLQLEVKPCDDVLERVISAAQVKADQKRIRLTPKISQEMLPSIQADQALLQQALYNLVDNAIKYTDPGGEVTISVQVEGDFVKYIVEDEGIGISPADQKNLFEKFFRVENRLDLDDEGSGLGLAIAKSIVDKHSGKIRVESQLGEGSKFYIELPLRQEAQ